MYVTHMRCITTSYKYKAVLKFRLEDSIEGATVLQSLLLAKCVAHMRLYYMKRYRVWEMVKHS